MKHLLFKVLCTAALCFVVDHTAHAQQVKYALVIGVKSYQYVAPLQSSLNDANDMAAILKMKGFTVVELYDPKTGISMVSAKGMWESAKGMDSHMPLAKTLLSLRAVAKQSPNWGLKKIISLVRSR